MANDFGTVKVATVIEEQRVRLARDDLLLAMSEVLLRLARREQLDDDADELDDCLRVFAAIRVDQTAVHRG